VVTPYVNAARMFLDSLPCPPSGVDLGCGDFSVGEQLRPHCGRYVACDVVPALIQRNNEKFAAAHVEFRCLDIIEGDLPDGDIVFLRQVLQHLNNAQISKVTQKLYHYKFLVLTEHVPVDPGFPPNRFCSGQSRSQSCARRMNQSVVIPGWSRQCCTNSNADSPFSRLMYTDARRLPADASTVSTLGTR
jgi:Methyltransferase domain